MILEIPDHDRRRFTGGAEAAGIWSWLQARGRLDRLPAALRLVDRDDLAILLTEAGYDGETPVVAPATDPRPAIDAPAPSADKDPPSGADPDSVSPPVPGTPSLRPTARVRATFGTRTGMTDLLGGFGATVGVAAVVIVSSEPFVSSPVSWSGLVALPLCVAWAVWRSWLTLPVVRRWGNPDVTVKIVVGDLFAQHDAHLVIGFTDTFDTAMIDDRLIAASSVQGQLLYRRYGDDHSRLDAELATALADHQATAVEEPTTKPLGKLVRYPIGTVAVIGRPSHHTFLVAYSRMGNDLVPRSSTDDIWHSLSRLWEAVDRHGRRLPIAMPVVGSGLARIDSLSPQNLAQLILLSYLARSRGSPVTRELRLVIWPGDVDKFDLPEIARFLKRL
jgi:Domain of unknown function (DUF6430)